MNCWAVIPFKAASGSKSRLAGVLGPQQRLELVESMARHVTDAALGAKMISRTCLVGPSRLGLPESIPLLNDPGGGLNPAVQSALEQALQAGPDRLIIIAGDLPSVTSQELDLLAIAAPDTIAIAPDRHETGTNAISLPLPAAKDFTFAFGIGSFAKHKAETERLGLKAEFIFSQGLERDVDEPEDLAEAQAALDTA